VSDTSVLFVCAGNICRSPTAEGVLRHRLAQEGLAERVEVDSAGLGGWHVGHPPDSRAIDRAAARGYDIGGLRARQFAGGDFARFDLILGMDQGHRSELARRRPPEARARVHLFLDYAGVGERGPDVPDPYFGGLEDYDLALDLIEPGIEGLIEALRRDFL
jgi:protein-tyrosine phosphatase